MYERKKTKKQTFSELFKETFKDTILNIGDENVSFVGNRMYIKSGKNIISVSFIGTEMAYSALWMVVYCPYGKLDEIIIPLNMIFEENKIDTGEAKIVNMKTLSGMNGIFTFVWTTELSDDDINALNNCLITYVETFSLL